MDLDCRKVFIFPPPSPPEPLHHATLRFGIDQSNHLSSPNGHLSHMDCKRCFSGIAFLRYKGDCLHDVKMLSSF